MPRRRRRWREPQRRRVLLCTFVFVLERERASPRAFFLSFVLAGRERERVAACPVPQCALRECECESGVVVVRRPRVHFEGQANQENTTRGGESELPRAQRRIQPPLSGARLLSPPLSLTLSHNGTHGLCDHSLLFCGGPPPRDTHLSLRRLCCQTPGSAHDHATTSTHTDSFYSLLVLLVIVILVLLVVGLVE